MIFCVAWHIIALRSWFSNDDFAWLSLPLLVNSWHDLPHVLFAPMAQGTIRVFSERLFFLTLGSIFDLTIIPFKLVVFLTQFANLALLTWIARRLTGSALAGFLAPIIWCAGVGLAEPLGWASAYNEVLIVLCVLLGFFFRLRWIDTGQRRYLYLEWLPYLFGFGVLETIVIYPALVMLYALCRAPKTLRSTLPLFLPAIAFVIFHFSSIPPSDDPNYKLIFAPSEVMQTLWTYWAMAAGALRLEKPEIAPIIVLSAVCCLLLLFLAVDLYRGRRLALFLLLWFPLTISPVLPLVNHVTEYYLAVPTLGLAMLTAWAASTAGWLPRAATVLVLGGFLFCSFAQVHPLETSRWERGRDMRRLLGSLEPHESEYEGKIVLLENVNEDLFWAGLLDRPLNLIGMPRVYLAPGGDRPPWLHAAFPDLASYEISFQDAYDLVSHGRAVVFSLAGPPVNSTAAFVTTLAVQQVIRGADIVNVADPDATARLGDGWYAVEGTTRWSKREASLWLQSSRPDQRLYIRGYCPEPLLQAGPLDLAVAVEGRPMAKFPIAKSNWFTFDAPLPAGVSGQGKLNFRLTVSRAYRGHNDTRELGLIFATFAVQK